MISSAAFSAFNAAASAAGAPSLPASIVTGTCPLSLTYAGSAPLSSYLSLLRNVTFRAGQRNGVPRSIPRQIDLYVGNVRSSPPFDARTYTIVMVTPVNDPIAWPALPPTVSLAENAEPLIEVTVAQDCAGAVMATIAPAGLCLTDPDPVLIPRSAGSFTGLTQLVTMPSLSASLLGARRGHHPLCKHRRCCLRVPSTQIAL